MNQLISNVLMQPRPDAVERLTLIEKLESKHEEFEADYLQMEKSVSRATVAGNMNGLRIAMNIIKEHQSVNLKKLTKVITNAIVYGRTTQASEQDQATTQVLVNDCFDAVKQHSDWVPVDERLPSDWSVVLCYGVPYEWDKTSKPNSNIFCAVYVAEYDRWSVGYSAFGDTSTQKVTHWQPLPQPPSEVQDD